jgi:hypothetical protein
LAFAGVPTSDLCRRYEGWPIDFWDIGASWFGGSCPLQPEGSAGSTRHIMVFPPADSDATDWLSPGWRESGEWSHWSCLRDEKDDSTEFFTAVASDEQEQRYRLRFRSVSCDVRLGRKLPPLERFRDEAKLARFFIFGRRV